MDATHVPFLNAGRDTRPTEREFEDQVDRETCSSSAITVIAIDDMCYSIF